MNKELAITDPSQLMISARVTFSYQNREWTGHVAKKGRAYVDIFHAAFAAAHALPDAAVADAARDYADFFDTAVPVPLVCENLNWSVYVVMRDVFGARWFAVPTYYGKSVALDQVDQEEALALNIPGLATISRFPIPPKGWR